MIIRNANENDINQIAILAQETYTQTFGDEMSPEDLTKALKTRDEDYFSQAIRTEEIVVAELGGKIVGFIQFGAVSYGNIVRARLKAWPFFVT